MRSNLNVWSVYLVECKDGSFYCGISNNVPKRIKKHNSGKGAKYTRGRGPVVLMCSAECESKSAALKLEAAVKRLPKKIKLQYLQKLQGMST